MKIRAKIALSALPLHRGNDFAPDDETADVHAARLFDELLDHDVDLRTTEGLDHRLRRVVRLTKHHANALGAFEQLDHHRCAAGDFNHVVSIFGGVRKAGDRQPNALAGQKLQRAQLVARSADCHGFVQRINPHHFELA
jgi:hypothetical protein